MGTINLIVVPDERKDCTRQEMHMNVSCEKMPAPCEGFVFPRTPPSSVGRGGGPPISRRFAPPQGVPGLHRQVPKTEKGPRQKLKYGVDSCCGRSSDSASRAGLLITIMFRRRWGRGGVDVGREGSWQAGQDVGKRVRDGDFFAGTCGDFIHRSHESTCLGGGAVVAPSRLG